MSADRRRRYPKHEMYKRKHPWWKWVTASMAVAVLPAALSAYTFAWVVGVVFRSLSGGRIGPFWDNAVYVLIWPALPLHWLGECFGWKLNRVFAIGFPYGWMFFTALLVLLGILRINPIVRQTGMFAPESEPREDGSSPTTIFPDP